jgi:hypothetical protein
MANRIGYTGCGFFKLTTVVPIYMDVLGTVRSFLIEVNACSVCLSVFVYK